MVCIPSTIFTIMPGKDSVNAGTQLATLTTGEDGSVVSDKKLPLMSELYAKTASAETAGSEAAVTSTPAATGLPFVPSQSEVTPGLDRVRQLLRYQQTMPLV